MLESKNNEANSPKNKNTTNKSKQAIKIIMKF